MKQDNPYEHASKPLPYKLIMFNNFLGGIFWALGATVGVSLLFAILALVAKQINLVPIVGTFVSNIITFVLTKNPNL